MSTSEPGTKRQLNFWDCLGVGLNGIIGTGIFLLPSAVLLNAGRYAPFSWVFLGIICVLIALCFAEASGHTERSGGPYRYACDVFGLPIGFIVGWITLVSIILGYAAVASEFGAALLDTFFINAGGWAKFAVSIALVLFLGIINLFGVKIGSRASFFISLVKIVSLLLFIFVGLFFVKKLFLFPELPIDQVQKIKTSSIILRILPSYTPLMLTFVFAGAFKGLFAITGFEYVPVPAGEVINPKKNIPLAMVFSLLGVVVLYILIQVIVTGIVSPLIIAGHNKAVINNPVVESVRLFLTQWKGAFVGDMGAKLTNLAKTISIFGFCAGSALVGPRYFEVLAEDSFLPKKIMQRSSVKNVPVYAVVLLTVVVIFFITWMRIVELKHTSSAPSETIFAKLSNLSNIAVLVQFISTCLSIMVLHYKKRFAIGGFSLGRWGYLIPSLAIMGCLLMLADVYVRDWIYAGIIAGVGILFGFLHRKIALKK